METGDCLCPALFDFTKVSRRPWMIGPATTPPQVVDKRGEHNGRQD